MSVPSEKYRSICAIGKRLEEVIEGGEGRIITKREAIQLLRHLPGPTSLWWIFEGKLKGKVPDSERKFWSEYK